MTEMKSYTGSSRTMTAVKPGMIKISFDDYWSAGDKGRSKQPIPGMGMARHRCAIRSFHLARRVNVPTHFIEEVRSGFIVQEMKVPTHEPLSGEVYGEVLPLEWIWRKYLKGSLWERVKTGEMDPCQLGYMVGHKPEEGEKLPKLRLECTTKFEPKDRKLIDEEARDLAKLSQEEWSEAWRLVNGVVRVTDFYATAAGFCFPDGKCELARRSRDHRIILADTFGTPDENRVLKLENNKIYSKDLIRNWLKEVGYSDQLKMAQDEFPKEPDKWPVYPELPEKLVQKVTRRYTAFADAYCCH